MKKNDLLSDEIWAFRPFELGTSPAALPPESMHDPMFWDEGDPYPLADAAAASVESLEVYAGKPVASIATLADYLVNGYWQYENRIAHHWASNTITYNISGLNSAEQFLALSALQAWSEVANITFVQTSGSANITFTHNGTMQAYATGSWYGSGAIASMTVNISTDWVTSDGGANDGKTGIDSYAYQTYIHEIGHALGLGHQGPYNGSASYSTNATYANDTWQYSIMSYFSQPNYSGSSYRYVVTPQMADIYAVASMYGAATSTRTGDTVYGFNSNAGAVFNFSTYTSAPALTIYDSGGNDTLDCSGYSAAQTIDLHAGAFSSIGGLTNNIGIALNAIIEYAIGGSGNDTLIAGAANCTLSGGLGNDTLIGGSGLNTLRGGIGADIYMVQSNGDTVFELVNEGIDQVQTSLASYVLSANVENLTFVGTSSHTGVGNELNNVIIGGDGNDYLIGFAGNDTLIDGSGLNTLQGGTGNDIYAVQSNADTVFEFANEGVDQVQTFLAAYALSANVENLTFVGASSHTGIGNELNNVIIGGTGNDYLIGLAGNDTLIDGSGLNTLQGGTGNDIYAVQSNADTVFEFANEGVDQVQTFLAAYVLSSNVENLTFVGSNGHTGSGNDLANVIIGSSGSDLLNGLTGNDTLTGGDGADTFVFSTDIAGGNNVDIITDFNVSMDRIVLDHAIFTAAGSSGVLAAAAFTSGAIDANDRIIYNVDTGALSYDADDSGPTAMVQFATLAPHLNLTSGNFLIV
jgi:Ca2+-binding RTX toxin-like protein